MVGKAKGIPPLIVGVLLLVGSCGPAPAETATRGMQVTSQPTGVPPLTDAPPSPETPPPPPSPQPKATVTRLPSPPPTATPDPTATPQPTATPEPTAIPTPAATLSPDGARATLEETAGQVIAAIRDKEMDRLTDFVHPDDGLRFSPYAYVRPDSDLVFDVEQIPDLLADETIYSWGTYDGSGAPINLAFSNYYDRFVYDADFADAEQIGFNEVLGTGNTINNASEVYPGSIIVEYHFPGFDPQFQGMDWKSLRLVFAEKEGTWYLVGVIHDEWTI